MNIQEQIIRGILELLYKQDYLVLPGFGGFVLKSQPSVFSGSGASLLPPSKKLGFNKQLRQNDGVLANWLQNELACDTFTAVHHLEEFAEYCNSILNSKRRLSIERLGFFYLDLENNFCFEPRTDVNFLSDSFGLVPLHLKAIETETPPPSVTPVKKFVDRPAPVASELPGNTKTKRFSEQAKKGLAYSALGLVMIFVLGFIITSVGVQGPLLSAVFHPDTRAEYKINQYPSLQLEGQQSDKAVLISTSATEAILTLEDDLRFVVLSPESRANLPKRETTSGKGPYRIVFGCFSVKANAKKFAKSLEEKNYPVNISKLEAKGLYVVALGGYANKEAASKDLSSIKTDFPHAWIKALP